MYILWSNVVCFLWFNLPRLYFTLSKKQVKKQKKVTWSFVLFFICCDLILLFYFCKILYILWQWSMFYFFLDFFIYFILLQVKTSK